MTSDIGQDIKRIMLRTMLRNGMFFCFVVSLPLYASQLHAASLKGTASVTIQEPLSGVTSQSNFSVGVAPSSVSAEAEEDLSTPEDDADTASKNIATFLEQTSIITPAKFTVFGLPNQVFSVVVPQSITTSSSDGANIILGGITHNAGATPTMNASGATSFSVGAGVQLNASGSASAPTRSDGGGNPDGSPAPTDDQAGELAAEGEKAATGDDTPATRAFDPFSYSPSSEGFLSVLISYN